LIHIDTEPSRDKDEGDNTVEGDQRIKEESVDVERRVGICPNDAGEVGRQDRDVIPASWPMRRASKVIENWCDLCARVTSERVVDNQ
jgi:hypothetical protein